MSMEITFLGTGTSQGVPLLACDCAVCRSADPRDRRLRTSALVEVDGRSILIDATPEFRLGALAAGVRRVDAVLLTHTHADHFLGLDDLRRFTQLQGRALDVYVPAGQLGVLDKVFGYARADRAGGNPDLPRFNFVGVEGPFAAAGVAVRPIFLPHGRRTVAGYRIGGLGYCTDCSEVPAEAVAALQGVRVLVLGALRHRRHEAHLSLGEAEEVARRVGAERTYFVHMSHEVSHGGTEVGAGCALAYDGLRVVVE